MHIVHDVFAGEDSALGQALGARPVHRQHRQDDVEAEVLVQVPGPEQGQVQFGPAHLGAVHAHQPGPLLPGLAFVMAQHQGIGAVIAGVAHPALRPRLAGVGLVAAVEGDPLMGTAAAGERPDRHVRRCGWGGEIALRLVQPAAVPVEIECLVNLAVDFLIGLRIAQGAPPQQADEHQFVAQRVGGQRQGGPGLGQGALGAAEIGAPRPRVVAAGFDEGPGERPDDVGQRVAAGGRRLALLRIALRTGHGPDGSKIGVNR